MSPAETHLSPYVAFEGDTLLAQGAFSQVIVAVKQAMEQRPLAQHWVFDRRSGAPMDFHYAGTVEQVQQRAQAFGLDAPTGSAPDASPTQPPDKSGKPGRPRLGVVAREVTLLPRHWDWLSQQTGGASVALRKLVEQARRDNADRDAQRQAQAACYRCMSALAGHLPGFEEAARALFAPDLARFAQTIAPWPHDVRQHLLQMAHVAQPEASCPT